MQEAMEASFKDKLNADAQNWIGECAYHGLSHGDTAQRYFAIASNAIT